MRRFSIGLVSALLAGLLALSGCTACRQKCGVPPGCDTCVGGGPQPPRLIPGRAGLPPGAPMPPGPPVPAGPVYPGNVPPPPPAPPGAVNPTGAELGPPVASGSQSRSSPPAEGVRPGSPEPPPSVRLGPIQPTPGSERAAVAPPPPPSDPVVPEKKATPEPPPASIPPASVPVDENPPVELPGFTQVLPGVASGYKPFEDGYDWLKVKGYKTVLHLHQRFEDTAAARRLVESKGLRYLSLEVSPGRLTLEASDQFNKIVGNKEIQPMLVFAGLKEGYLAGGMWYLYFRREAKTSADKAREEANRLGLLSPGLDSADEANNRAMWLKIQKLLEKD